MKDLEMPGSTEQNFINRFVEDWFSKNPNAASYFEIAQQVEGIIRWHHIMCSTPLPWLSKPLVGKINRAMIKAEAGERPWFHNAALRDMNVFGDLAS